MQSFCYYFKRPLFKTVYDRILFSFNEKTNFHCEELEGNTKTWEKGKPKKKETRTKIKD